MTKIKVCGITQERDAIEAVHLGADALGFVLSRGSPRSISPRDAGRIVSKLPPFVARIGVFADEPSDRVAEAIWAAGLTVLEFRGNETPEYCRRFSVSWYKGLRIDARFATDDMVRYGCTSYLLDKSDEEGPERLEPGTFWSLAQRARSYGRIILGGGLSEESVRRAVLAARPYAVEAREGVEFAPGLIDIDRLEAFMDEVRAADVALL